MLVKNDLSIEQGRSCEGHPPPRMELAAPTSAALSASLLSPLANKQIYFEILVCLDTIITPIYFVFTDTKRSVTNIQIYFYIHTLDYCSLDCTVFSDKYIPKLILSFFSKMSPLEYSFGSFFQFKHDIWWNHVEHIPIFNQIKQFCDTEGKSPRNMPVFLHAQIGVGERGGAGQNVWQTVLKADLPQNFYVYMYLNINFLGQFFHFHMTKKCGKVIQNFALFRLSDFCNWTLVKRGSVKMEMEVARRYSLLTLHCLNCAAHSF